MSRTILPDVALDELRTIGDSEVRVPRTNKALAINSASCVPLA